MLLTIICLSILISNAYSQEASVQTLTDENFDTRLAKYNVAMVLFFAPWCGYCKKLKPELAKAAVVLNNNYPSVPTFEVDCTDSGKATCERYHVESYPTLQLFRKGVMAKNYDGPRDVHNIVDFVLSSMDLERRIKEVNSVIDLENFLREVNETTSVGFFETNTTLKSEFLRSAERLGDKYKFAITSSKELLEKYEMKDNVVLFRPIYLHNTYEENMVVYEGKHNTSMINDFLNENSHGLVGHRTYINKNDFKYPIIITYVDLDFKNNSKLNTYWRSRLLKVAKQFKNQIRFAIAKTSEFKNELLEFGIIDDKRSKPFVTARTVDNKRYLMEDDFSTNALENFVKGVLTEKLKPHVKSQPVPKDNNDVIKIAVADNFEEVVMNSSRDVMIGFYAPWCSTCQNLLPLARSLANQLKNEDIVFVAMDATKNDVPPQFKVYGYPTVYWIPKDYKDQPVKYTGEYTIPDIITFIAERTSNELKGYDRQGNAKHEKIEL